MIFQEANAEMKLQTLFSLLTSGRLALYLQFDSVLRQAYRSSFVAAGLAEGLYARLSEGPATLDQLHQCLIGRPSPGTPSGEAATREKLQAWLEMGVSLGELKLTPEGYVIRSRRSRQLAEPGNDALAALYQEVLTMHHDLILQTPARLREQRFFTFADMDGELIARSSRVLEPYILEAVDSVVREKGAFRLLEVGCGSGVYIRHACHRNGDLQAVGLELQPDVAEYARKNLQAWGLAERVRVDTGDIRTYASPDRFDLVTLHNNIYYFPISERADLIRRLVNLLKPGGKLMVTTACQGSQQTLALNLWGEMTEGAGPLPEPEAVSDLMNLAGLISPRKTELVPGSGFFGFVGSKG